MIKVDIEASNWSSLWSLISSQINTTKLLFVNYQRMVNLVDHTVLEVMMFYVLILQQINSRFGSSLIALFRLSIR